VQVILHKRATNYRALLQKMTHEDKAFYESTPPCIHPGKCAHETAVGKTAIGLTGKNSQKTVL